MLGLGLNVEQISKVCALEILSKRLPPGALEAINMPVDVLQSVAKDTIDHPKEEGVSFGPLEKQAKSIPGVGVENLDKPVDLYSLAAKDAPAEKLGEDKEKVKEMTGWPDSIVDNCRTMDEVEVYTNANLKVDNVNGRDCLIRTDINYDLEIDGETNLERMKEGKCPVTDDGQKIELHHIGQNPDAPLAELTQEEHRGKDSDIILHNKTIEESQIDRIQFRIEREEHWRARAEEIENRNNEQNN